MTEQPSETADDLKLMEEDIFRDFLDETLEQLNGIDNLLIRIEQEPANLALINEVFRPVHSLKGNSAFFGLLQVKKLAHEAENVLDALRKEVLVVNPAIMRALLRAGGELRSMLRRVQAKGPEIADPAFFDALLAELDNALKKQAKPADSLQEELIKKLDSIRLQLSPDQKSLVHDLEVIIGLIRGRQQEAQAPQPPAPAGTPPPPPATAPDETAAAPSAAESRKTMRVPELYIDGFLSYVGELIVVGEMFNHLRLRLLSPGNNLHQITVDFQRANDTFTALSDALQKSIMNIRKVPARQLLGKAPRLARDTAAQAGKEVQVRIIGDDIEMDKSILEVLDSPMTHLVRNAVDHGIELPEARLAAGKPRHGTVTLTVEEAEAFFVVSIADDGAGLQLERIRQKAVSMGMLAADRPLTQKETIDIIFQSGVSTATKITDISGRGVGLDVVRSSILQSGGSIEVETTPGQGTRFILRLKKGVTTQIMRGFLVAVAGQTYIFPMDRVRETVRIQTGEIRHVVARGAYIQRHGRILPLLDVQAVLEGEADASGISPERLATRSQGCLVVTIEALGKERALLIDDVVGVQQIVLKEIRGLHFDGDIMEGGALLGDGRVALVINPDKLCANFNPDLPA